MPVTYDFSGRNAIVTGAASGIGQEIARQLADAGANVTGWDRQSCGTDRIAEQIVDVTEPETLAAAITEHAAGVDILVHSAGYGGQSAPVLQYDPAEWRRIIDINLNGTYEILRHVTPAMLSRPAGRIVLLASIAGKEGTPNAAAYSASKAGVIALAKAFSKELVGTNVRINCIAPGPIKTKLLEQFTQAHVDTMISKCPLARLGTVEELSTQILWMCSEDCTFVTGATFDHSGGRAVY